jgi:CubicO group peptidase (beta-lactamase class C family)
MLLTRPAHGWKPFRSTVALVLAVLVAFAISPGMVLADDAFPPASPESQGLSSEALDALADVVQGYVDRDMAVGAELVVIQDRNTVLHEAFGWRDQEAEEPMERDTIFNIRSMTKPITGAAIQLLIDEGSLALDDRVADYLPGFDNDDARDITIEQLLTHRSGLPLTTLTSPRDHETLSEMVAAIGEGGPEFEPASRFWYSDAGTDALGAIVAEVSGSPLDEFVSDRLLGPLGMADTYYAGDPDDPRLDRTASLYMGGVGDWGRIWGPEEEPFYPFAWGSQSLYGTPLDYARFLAMWMDGGEVDGTSILSPEAMTRTLTPTARMGSLGSEAPYPTRFTDLTAYHGQMAVLHAAADPVDGEPPPGVEPTILGYSGSDGTIAWAWPERDLMILYFTQSRGGATPIRLEQEIQRLLLDPAEATDEAVPAEYMEYVGTYNANFGPFRNEPFEVLWRDGGLALDIPSQFIFALDQVDEQDRWSLRDDPAVEISFVADEVGGVSALRIDQGGGTIDVPKGQPESQDEDPLQFEDAAPYLGWYREAGAEREFEILFQDGRLALRIPESQDPLELLPADGEGLWRLRLQPVAGLLFVDEDGSVDSFEVRGPDGEATFERISAQSPSPNPAS